MPSCAWFGDPHRQDASLRQGQKNLNLLTALRLQFRRHLRASGAHLSPPSLVSRGPDNLDQHPKKATAPLVAFFFLRATGDFFCGHQPSKPHKIRPRLRALSLATRQCSGSQLDLRNTGILVATKMNAICAARGVRASVKMHTGSDRKSR